MKVKISRQIWVTETVEIPKEWEFVYQKEEDDYTDEEWDFFENNPFLGITDDFDIDEIIED